jgi:hypothetical protein
VRQLPVLGPSLLMRACPWGSEISVSDWILKRVLRLSYTANDIAAMSQDLGYDGPPFSWDINARLNLRAELDAALFHLYGIERDDVAYIMETFPIVKRKDVAAHGEYRTKRLILEIYDAMAEAERTGKPYNSLFDDKVKGGPL